MRTIIYKLAHDILAITIASFGLLTASEVIFPGFLTHFISFTHIIIVFEFTLCAIALTRPKKNPKHATTTQVQCVHNNKPIALSMLFLMLALTAITLRNFALWELLTILTLLATLVVSLVRNDPTKKPARASDHAQ